MGVSESKTITAGKTSIRAGTWEQLTAGRWGWMPVLSMVLAIGLLTTAIAFQGAVSNSSWATGLFWASLLMMIMPVTARLASLDADRRERIGLVLLLGAALYLVKVMHSPFTFTFSDELVHAFNVDEILRTHHLFGNNAILPVTTSYPGLETVTAALAQISGLSTYAAGMIVVATGRLIISLALFLFYEKFSQSQRLAGLATVIYMANSNYLFWSAQFSYESLALPLAILVLFAVVYRQEQAKGKQVAFLTGVSMMLILAIVVTHHLTSFALIGALFTVAALYSVTRLWNLKRYPSIWGIAWTALAALVFWLTFVAKSTLGYILPVAQGALFSSIRLVTGAQSGRELFTNTAGVTAPSWEQWVGIASVLLILFGIPLGLLQLWRRYRRSAFALFMALAALAYFPIQGMRLTGAGWETANRASEFLFVGISFVLALGAITYWIARPNFRNTMATTIFVAILFAGGVVSGWPPALRLPKPYEVAVEMHGKQITEISPQGLAAANWTRRYLGKGNRMATDNSDALLLQRYGGQIPLSGGKYGVRDLFFADKIGRGEMEILDVTQVRYLVFARSAFNWDRMLGLYYDPTWGIPPSQIAKAKNPNSAKFDAYPGISRVLDTGNIMIYDLGGTGLVPTK